jgi:hypothetical protein
MVLFCTYFVVPGIFKKLLKNVSWKLFYIINYARFPESLLSAQALLSFSESSQCNHESFWKPLVPYKWVFIGHTGWQFSADFFTRFLWLSATVDIRGLPGLVLTSLATYSNISRNSKCFPTSNKKTSFKYHRNCKVQNFQKYKRSQWKYSTDKIFRPTV